MYEDVTYEVILDRMLDRVLEQNPNIDTREGSIIYNALAPAAVELQNMYIQLDTILNESFADTQTRDYLIKRCAERGVNVEAATYAIRKGEFTPNSLAIPIGSRFSLGILNYVIEEKIEDGAYKLKCETVGYDGNVESGTLIPIDYIEGLETATLTDVLIPGEDEEDTEHLRQRYFDSLNSQAFGGNVTDYKEKVQVGAYSVKANAEAMLKKLQAAGYSDAFITYTGSSENVSSSSAIKVGDKVKVLKATTYSGKSFKLYYSKYDVLEVNGDRVVIGIGKTVTAAVHKDNLQKL